MLPLATGRPLSLLLVLFALAPSGALAQSSSDGSSSGLSGLGSIGIATPPSDSEALAGLVTGHGEYAAQLGTGASIVLGRVTLGSGEPMRAVGVRIDVRSSYARYHLVRRDGTVLALMTDSEGGLVHLTGIESGAGTLRTPETLTGCATIEEDRIRLDCGEGESALSIDVRVLSAAAVSALSARDRGWASALVSLETGTDEWDPRIRPTWVSRDGARARFSVRVEATQSTGMDWSAPVISRLVDGTVEVRLGDALGALEVDGEPTVSSVRPMTCGPPYHGCCSAPPRECTIGPPLGL